MARLLLVLICATCVLMGGQSITLNAWAGAFVSSASCPNISDSSNFRLEFRVHNAAAPASNVSVFFINCLDMYIQVQASGLLYVVEQVSGANFIASGSARSEMLVRVQRNISAGRVDVEVWDVDGGNYQATAVTGLTFSGSYATANAGFNAWAHGNGNAKLAFMRAFTTLVPLGSRPPTTADVGDYFDWKFDGNGADSSGNGRTVNVSGASFVATPVAAAVAIAKTANTPSWAPFRPLRAGHPGQLDATASCSMADAGDEVTCFWQQVPHASGEPLTSQVIFDNRNSCTPTVTGLVFGPYRFRLQVTDADGAKATADLDAGAVAYDENGVVIYPDERLYAILGPAKVYGANDWEWLDERQTVIGPENWKGYKIHGGTMTLEAEEPVVNGIARTGTVYTDIPAQNSLKIYGSGTNFLEVFCGGRVGPAVKSAVGVYIVMRTPGNLTPYAYERQVGSCQSDTELTLVSGWHIDTTNWNAGISSPGTTWGTRGLGSYKQDGSGTVYTSASTPNKIFGLETDFLTRFCGGQVGSITTQPGILVIEDSLVTRKNVASCQSDTELTLISGQTWDTTHIASPGVAWGYEDPSISMGQWSQSFSVSRTSNYYDVAKAHYALYFRSGWIKARDAARFLAGKWWRTSTFSAWRSAALEGPLILHTFDTSAPDYDPDFWPYFRNFLGVNTDGPITASLDCGTSWMSDVREMSFCMETLANAALLDPDSDQRAEWRSRLQSVYDAAWGVKQTPWGFYVNEDTGTTSTSGEGPVYQFSNGSTVVTKISGADISANFCGDPATFYSAGTIVATNGSTAIAGTGTDFTGQAGKRIFIRGTLDGQPYSQLNEVASVSGSDLTLLYPWAGDTGTAAAYRIQAKTSSAFNAGDGAMFGTVITDASGVDAIRNRGEGALYEAGLWHWCTVDSTTQLTLDRPFTGDTSSTPYRQISRGNSGSNFSIFFQEIAAIALGRAAKALDGYDDTRAAGYRARRDAVIGYLQTVAAERSPQGLRYSGGSAACFPAMRPNFCDRAEPTATQRDYMVEGNQAFAEWYLDAPSAPKLATLEQWTGLQYSRVDFASVDGDGHNVALIEDSSYRYNLAKFYGQTFGVGASHAPSGARAGGPAAADSRTIKAGFNLASVPNAAKVRVSCLQANGEIVTATSETMPVSITGDFRGGSAACRHEFLSASDAVLAPSTEYTLIQ